VNKERRKKNQGRRMVNPDPIRTGRGGSGDNEKASLHQDREASLRRTKKVGGGTRARLTDSDASGAYVKSGRN